MLSSDRDPKAKSSRSPISSKPAVSTIPTPLPTLLQRAQTQPHTLRQQEVAQLQRAVGNRAVGQLLQQKNAAPTSSPAVVPTPTRIMQRQVTFATGPKTVDQVKTWLGEAGHNLSTKLIDAFLKFGTKNYTDKDKAQFAEDFTQFATSNKVEAESDSDSEDTDEGALVSKKKATGKDWKTKEAKEQLAIVREAFAGIINSLHHKAAKSVLEQIYDMLSPTHKVILAQTVLGVPDASTKSIKNERKAMLRRLKSLASNLAAGPWPELRSEDPGSKPDFNKTSSGKLTPRSEKYERILAIHNKAQSQGKTQLDVNSAKTVIALLKEAQEIHIKLVGSDKLDPHIPFEYDAITKTWRKTKAPDSGSNTLLLTIFLLVAGLALYLGYLWFRD